MSKEWGGVAEGAGPAPQECLLGPGVFQGDWSAQPLQKAPLHCWNLINVVRLPHGLCLVSAPSARPHPGAEPSPMPACWPEHLGSLTRELRFCRPCHCLLPPFCCCLCTVLK